MVELAYNASVFCFLLVEKFVLHLFDFQFQLEFFNVGLVKVLGHMFNVFIQLVQFPFYFFQFLRDFQGSVRARARAVR